MYGLEQYGFLTCVMYFSNILEETDRSCHQFCPWHEANLSQALQE
jgi:predicted Zn-dependent protease